jgi:two-component system sensor histidine kinase DegS
MGRVGSRKNSETGEKGSRPGDALSFPERLNVIITEVVQHIEASKEQVFEISENIRREMDRLEAEIDKVKEEVGSIIAEVDELAALERTARVRLMEVSRDFSRFSEADIKQAYEDAQNMQSGLALLREREKQVRLRRDQLEISRNQLNSSMEAAQSLASRVAVVLNYLNGGMKDLGAEISDIQQKQQLAMGIIRAQEEERKRLAREIHDGPAQLLANTVMRADFCVQLWEKKSPDIKKEILSVENMARLALKDLRKIIFELRPMLLDDLGLIPAIKRFLNGTEEHSDLKTEFLFFGRDKRMEPALEVALFRIIQESVGNVQKHAGASKVVVKLELLVNKVNLNIRDNGCGFDAEAGSTWKAGFGLVGMRERAQLFGGELTVVSDESGTLVAASIPLQDD